MTEFPFQLLLHINLKKNKNKKIVQQIASFPHLILYNADTYHYSSYTKDSPNNIVHKKYCEQLLVLNNDCFI